MTAYLLSKLPLKFSFKLNNRFLEQKQLADIRSRGHNRLEAEGRVRVRVRVRVRIRVGLGLNPTKGKLPRACFHCQSSTDVRGSMLSVSVYSVALGRPWLPARTTKAHPPDAHVSIELFSLQSVYQESSCRVRHCCNRTLLLCGYTGDPRISLLLPVKLYPPTACRPPPPAACN